MIDKLVRDDTTLGKLVSTIKRDCKTTVFGVNDDQKLLITNEANRPIIYVVASEKDIENVSEKLRPSFRVNSISSFDFRYTDIPMLDSVSNLFTLLEFSKGNIDALVVSASALTNKYPKLTNVLNKSSSIEIDQSYDLGKIKDNLVSFGYTRVDSVSEHGEFSIRGDVLDVFLPNMNDPIRVSFFDDTVERIYSFDSITFSKIKDFDQVSLAPFSFIKSFSESRVQELTSVIESSKIVDTLKDNIINKLNYGSNKSPWFYAFEQDVCDSLFDYAPDNTLVVVQDTKQVYDYLTSSLQNQKENVLSAYKNNEVLDIHKDFYFELDEVLKHMSQLSILGFGLLSSNNRLFESRSVFTLKTSMVMSYINTLKEFAPDMVRYYRRGYTIVVYGKNQELANKLFHDIERLGVSPNIVKNAGSVSLGDINILPKENNLSGIFDSEKIVVVGTNMLVSVRNKPKKKNDFVYELPKVGDYVVHDVHGVGQYIGNKTMLIGQTHKEYFVIKYKNDDALYLPVEYADKIVKFVGGDESPKLNKLGGTEFFKTKTSVKAGLKKLAFDLVKLYKERQDSVGHIYLRDKDIESEIDRGFRYTLTDDQERAVEDIYEDLSSTRIMDRLICGDVGYGKTEVSLRAIYRVIMGGGQVMFMCPTTILSQQHYNTALSRLGNYGVNIEVLNRFKTTREQKDILARLEQGQIDLLCGTHRLLSSDVSMPNLQLLVLDEEQKFGVADKEKIKNLKKKINVLTLSATPIPRTLNMALVGIRDISVINTPPTNRLNVVTSVVEYSDSLVSDAVSRELDRGGQVLIVYNRVESIFAFKEKIRKIVGEDVVIDVAHGQMCSDELEDAILRLYNGHTQILIATTLIENGVDLPQANTLIVIDSDNLGLAQLYQLKGRIGRSDRQAYAYFTFGSSKLLTENGYKRLSAIAEYCGMGSGYKIAMRDLEIRGAGNVFGAEQSGHMAKVGYNTYLSLLKETVDEIQGHDHKRVDTLIETSIQAYIPDYYIDNRDERISVYTSVAKLDSKMQMTELCDELKSMYGSVPDELVNLMKIAVIKNIASANGISKVSIDLSKAELVLADMKYLNDQILEILDSYKDIFVLNMTSLPIIKIDKSMTIKLKMESILQFLCDISALKQKNI